jgi:hypothetical protein
LKERGFNSPKRSSLPPELATERLDFEKGVYFEKEQLKAPVKEFYSLATGQRGLDSQKGVFGLPQGPGLPH